MFSVYEQKIIFLKFLLKLKKLVFTKLGNKNIYSG